jgi:hypothetical protein
MRAMGHQLARRVKPVLGTRYLVGKLSKAARQHPIMRQRVP